jgi:hypothetical protein
MRVIHRITLGPHRRGPALDNRSGVARYLFGVPEDGDLGRWAGHDLLPLSLMIRGVVSPGLVASMDR